MKKPKIFKNENIDVNNNLDYCYLENINVEEDNNIKEELDKLFANFNNLYTKKVEIKTNNNTITTKLLSRTNNNIMTINRKIIPIKEIISLKIK